MEEGPMTRRGLLVLVSAAALLVAGAGIGAWATYPSTVDVYAGCLTTSGTGAGQISKVALGSSPLKPCSSTQRVVNLSGGTITSVSAGSGLTGGGSNGAVTIGLESGYALPQTCADGEVVGQTNGQFACYVPTDGLVSDPSNNTIGLRPTYQLLQFCSAGEFLSWTSAGWTCARVEDPRAFIDHQSSNVFLTGFNPQIVAELDLPAGHYLVSGKASITNRNSDDQDAACYLRVAAGVVDESDARIGDASSVLDPGDGPNEQVIPVMGLLAGPTRVLLLCATYNGLAKFGVITAVEVA
jgi:hypothetical protein